MSEKSRPGQSASPGPRLSGVLARYPQFQAADRVSWRAWLVENHASTPGVWLVTYKKNSGGPWLPYDDAVEEALCFGWVDSRPARLDEQRTMLLFTPRKPGSVWARTNKARVAKLIAAGQMAPAGWAAVERAERDGSWTSLDEVEANIVPGDLASAFAEDPSAAQRWNKLSAAARRQTIQWLASAKRAATRAQRIARITREGRPAALAPKTKSRT